jgi:mannose-1-phosphate guanylyltransferase
MLDRAYAVIMAGGKGERFWPLSTSKHPKQLLSLVGNKPLIAMAVGYLRGLIPPERIIVITSADLVSATHKAAPQLLRANIIGEPLGRDTAAVCALGSALVQAQDPKGAFCILTADHIIKDVSVFQRTLREGFSLAMAQDVLVTIGIRPTFPHTGFGYIEAGPPWKRKNKVFFAGAKRFVEKPDRRTAERYLASGRFFWNAGMFIWSVDSFQRALEQHAPPLLRMAKRMRKAVGCGDFKASLDREYRKLQKVSVDYAVMEKADNIVMARGSFRWDDVGSWPALENHFEKDEEDNLLLGVCKALDSTGNLVVSNERLTALIGVKDLVVVQAGEATLVCAKNRAQDVKKMVQLLAASGRHRDIL